MAETRLRKPKVAIACQGPERACARADGRGLGLRGPVELSLSREQSTRDSDLYRRTWGWGPGVASKMT